jgi:hypothetical protein
MAKGHNSALWRFGSVGRAQEQRFPAPLVFKGLKKTTNRLVTGDVLKLCNRVRKQQAAKAIKTIKWICKKKQLIGADNIPNSRTRRITLTSSSSMRIALATIRS